MHHGSIPVLISICKNYNKLLKKLTLPILCQFIHTSPYTRQMLLKHSFLRVLKDFLRDDNFILKVLDTIVIWLELDAKQVESILTESDYISAIIESFARANKNIFQQIVPMVSKLIYTSELFTQKLIETNQFMEELVNRLDIDLVTGTEGNATTAPTSNEPGAPNNSSCTNSNNLSMQGSKDFKSRAECVNPSPLVRKELLEILLQLSRKHSSPKALMDIYNLQPIIQQIQHLAQSDDMVILEEISSQLLQLYFTPEIKVGAQQQQPTSSA